MATWEWKSDLRTSDGTDWAWSDYAAKDSKAIEAEYKKGSKSFVLNKKYKIDFRNMIQHRTDDYNRQRDIRRTGGAKMGARKAQADSDSDSDAPPAKKAKTTGGKALKNCVIAMSGSLTQTRAQIATLIENNGGDFSKGVTHSCTHLLTTAHEVANPTDKVYDARKKSVTMVSEAWLRKSIALGVAQPTSKYEL
eukprot:NODE_1990_length_791_cov_111.149596_g1582_i0.p1 GENE.NODE_1990_length_791_cov_111.149596_g1582_i0~~NODE_1990_length_791_cov_111.149596_g1582_i0.p1  ORF type:complete len:194 (-),score=32.24 NODE_1990_length_791_cov_111.149596_g1582_i0:142-723(-)